MLHFPINSSRHGDRGQSAIDQAGEQSPCMINLQKNPLSIKWELDPINLTFKTTFIFNTLLLKEFFERWLERWGRLQLFQSYILMILQCLFLMYM